MTRAEKIKYNKGFVDGYKKATEQANAVIEDIKAEIAELQKEYKEYGWAYDDALEVIDKHIGERSE